MKKLKVLIAVGSRRDRVCSIGAFARAEALALQETFERVEILEPNEKDEYPRLSGAKASDPDVVLFHSPALHDRKRPWNALVSAVRLKAAYPKAKFVPIVHEFSEAPLHWKVRQLAILKLGHGAVVNSTADLQGVDRWHRKVLKTSLGPTLFIPELLVDQTESQRAALLRKLRDEARAAVGADRWVVHPGLLTPGKGINFLSKLEPIFPRDAKLVLMGGLGPKERDRRFARQTLADLRSKFGNERVVFVDSPDDEKFKQVLIASELVVLPYDNGVSERRSSFLSAMCCGANVWTTIGPFSDALRIEATGVHRVSVEQWRDGDSEVLRSLERALAEPDQKQIERRLANLKWAATRSWQARALRIREFVESL